MLPRPAGHSLGTGLRGEQIHSPIPGTKRQKYLLDNTGAMDVTLTTADFTQIDDLLKRFPNIGDRYNEGNYRFLEKTETPG